jgi:hypothetical protein
MLIIQDGTCSKRRKWETLPPSVSNVERLRETRITGFDKPGRTSLWTYCKRACRLSTYVSKRPWAPQCNHNRAPLCKWVNGR